MNVTQSPPARACAAAALTALLLSVACSDTADQADVTADAPDLTADSPLDATDGSTEPDMGGLLDVADTFDLGAFDLGGHDPNAIPHTEPTAGLDPSGHTDILSRLPAGAVRAGRIQSAETSFGGVGADCRVGDFKIYNAQVQFCVADVVPTTLFNFSGGQLIDADVVGEANDHFLLLGAHNHFNVAGGTSVEVVADGRDGLAVVRVRGPEEPVRILAELVGLVLPFRGVSFETEYRLRPDTNYLEVVTWVRANDGLTAIRAGDIPLFGDSTRSFFPGFGRSAPVKDAFDFAAATASGRSYALYAPEPLESLGIDFSELGSSYDILPLVMRRGIVERGRELSYRRWLIVGDGDTGSLRRAMAEIDGQSLPDQSLIVDVAEVGEQVGEPVADLLLLVSDAAGAPRDLIATDAQGRARLSLPPGDYRVGPEDWVGGAVAAVDVTVADGADTEVDLALPEAARVSFSVSALDGDDTARPSPAKIMLYGPRPERIFLADGSHSGLFRPGTYRVEISRGEEFTATVLEAVTLVGGANPTIEATLERVWDTSGLVSGEFHQHMTRSPDSDVSARDRLLSNITEGVDFVVPTDHEYVSDYTPTIAELGVSEQIHFMPSTEVSPLAGHLNPMPMQPDPGRPGNGAYEKAVLDLASRTLDIFTFPEIVADLRANYGARVIQLNHPRAGFGQFDTADYDPVAGPDAAIRAHFTTDFDSIEVYNETSLFCQVLDDWLGLVARGYRITGVGNSDTHSLRSLAGFPRNYLPSSASRPDGITDEEILTALETGSLIVSGGALITFPDFAFPGDLVNTSGDAFVALPLHIQTPVWSGLDEVLVIVGGQVVETIAVTAAPEVVVAVDETVLLDAPDSDTYLLVVAWGNTPMPIVTPGKRPFGMTNPIYLDADGDGEWTPPGISGPNNLPGLDIPWCD